MEAPDMLDRPPLGRHGDPCASCGVRLAQDQRYCLACGARRGGLPAMLSGPPEPRARLTEIETVVETPPVPGAWRPDSSLAAGVACLLLALLVGVLIGRSGREATQAAAPQVVTVSAQATPSATPGGATAAVTAFASDWPEGKKGFTIELRTLPKDSTDAAAVTVAKQEATSAGAADVGALDSDSHSSLDPGDYVIYSGQFADKKAASGALDGLSGSFPQAKVVEVASAGDGSGGAQTKPPSAKEQGQGAKAIKDLEGASPEEYQKKSAKLPKQLTTPGKLPPADDKPAGAGSGSETFE